MLKVRASFTLLTLLFTCLLGPAAYAQAGSISVDDWFVSATVNNFNLGDDSKFFYTVQNPFNASHTATIAGSTCQASYDFAWWNSNATFVVQSTQAAEGVPTSMLFTASSGKIYVTPSVDLALTINAQWTYDLPADWMEANLLVTVFDPNNHVTIWGRSLEAETFPGEPASGALAFDGSVTLPAGATWVLRYGMQLTTWGGTQGYTGTGNGYVNFQLTPEPAAVFLLPLAAVLLRCRPV